MYESDIVVAASETIATLHDTSAKRKDWHGLIRDTILTYVRSIKEKG